MAVAGLGAHSRRRLPLLMLKSCMKPGHIFGQSFVLVLLMLCAARVSVGSSKFSCWPLSSNAWHPQPYQSCPGIAAEWMNDILKRPKTGQAFNVTFQLKVNSSFYTWAVTKGIFGNAGASGFRNAGAAQTWCESTKCPEQASEANETNCCLHYVNVHFCPKDPAYPSSPCRPWLPKQGSIFTHSTAQTSPITTGKWIKSVEGIEHFGIITLIAVFKIAGMLSVLEMTVAIQQKSDCGNEMCEEGEDCENCPDDCGWCQEKISDMAGIIGGVLIILLTLAILKCFVWFHMKTLRRTINDESWIIPLFEIIAGSDQVWSSVNISPSSQNLTTIPRCRRSRYRTLICQVSTAYVRGQTVALKRYYNDEFQLTETIRKEVQCVRFLEHPNVCRFIGGTVQPGTIYILFEFCPKGSLTDILQNQNILLNWAFRFSMLSDIARGMSYLHKNKIVHGRLMSSNCVVDDRWTCKVTDYGLQEYRREKLDSGSMMEHHIQKARRQMVYRAPESVDNCVPASDVYSFAIIMIEVSTRELPSLKTETTDQFGYSMKPTLPQFSAMVEGSESSMHIKPIAVKDRTQNYTELIKKCWADKPADRPNFVSVLSAISLMNPSKRTPVDTMMDLMQMYSKNLEALVEERSQQLLEEKQRTDKLLYNILPRRVAESLKLGNTVTAEWFDGSTVFFSDIVGFTSLSARSTPLEVVEILNKLYTTFDSIIEKHNVYKVETIGDAYMVVSGVPERTELHAFNVGMMSLEIMTATREFVIPHLPEEPLLIRVGLGSGPVCAGVVGIKMPRYCLFGDTVNTASRMESYSEAYKIHISHPTYEELQKFGTFECVSRGKISVKGKGEMHTWWLVGTKEAPAGWQQNSAMAEVSKIPSPQIGHDSHSRDNLLTKS